MHAAPMTPVRFIALQSALKRGGEAEVAKHVASGLGT
jgi:hypothetical protein